MNQYTLPFFFRDKAALKYFPFKIKRQQKKKTTEKLNRNQVNTKPIRFLLLLIVEITEIIDSLTRPSLFFDIF